MARYVLIRIEDNDEAEAFVKSIQQNDVFFSQSNADGTGSYGYLKALVRGFFGAPTLYCECNVKDNEKSARSKRFGWWVHRPCGKPRRGNMQHPKNLLDPVETLAAHRRTYIGIYEPWSPEETQ